MSGNLVISEMLDSAGICGLIHTSACSRPHILAHTGGLQGPRDPTISADWLSVETFAKLNQPDAIPCEFENMLIHPCRMLEEAMYAQDLRLFLWMAISSKIH